MASLTNRGGKRPLVKFSLLTDAGTRTTERIYLPATWSEREQDAARSHIGELARAKNSGEVERDRTMAWVASLDHVMHARLARYGLVPAREERQVRLLGYFLKWAINEIANPVDGKPLAATTIEIYERTVRNLVTFFGPKSRIDRITQDQAKEFRQWLLSEANRNGGGLKAGVANKRLAHCKHWFSMAVQKRWISHNPFACLQGLYEGQAASAAERVYVPAVVIDDLIDDAPDNEWKLLLALWRYAGLRHLEPLELRLKHISWSSDRMTVRAEKNKRYAGKYERVIPIWPEVRPYLLQQCEDAQEAGSKWLVFKRRYKYDEHKGTTSRSVNGSIRSRLKDQLLRTGTQPWPDLFKALRSSGETDRLNQRDDDGDLLFNPSDVAYWWNHSGKVQQKHYYTVTPDAFAKATGEKQSGNRAANRGSREVAQ